ncbi:MAG TPA: class I SAM-dependent methyltransferase, partial [Ornithinibacter sp.]|nr:class I SAM-dependent methyltransferase [Ornithinibacter sp.]
AALESGSARFLDVGVGVAAISAGLCQLYDGLTCVGVDVLPHVLGLGASELQRLGLSDRVVLRQQSVADLPDLAAFDLAWLPQPFVPRAAFEAGVARVHRALSPDRWVVVPLAATTASEPFEVAVFAHSAHVLGGGPMSTQEAESLLVGAGFVDVRPTSWRSQVLVLARRP